MGEYYARSATLPSTIYNVIRLSPDAGSLVFGTWLASEIRRRGLNQSEFAKLVGVGTSTVSRWINGRLPEASLLERIADVLVLDYDILATRAGYRPRELLEMDPDSAEAQLLPYIRAIEWSERELEMVKAQLRFLAEVQRGAHDR